MKTILAITPYNFSETDFYKLREPIRNYPFEHFERALPEFCVRDNGRMDWSVNYHQFSGLEGHVESDVEVLFDAEPVDYLLAEEISMGGIECLFETFDWNTLFSKVPINDAPINSKYIPSQVHVVVDLQYHGSRDVDGYMDYELEAVIVGYLDGNMQFCEI